MEIDKIQNIRAMWKQMVVKLESACWRDYQALSILLTKLSQGRQICKTLIPNQRFGWWEEQIVACKFTGCHRQNKGIHYSQIAQG